MLEYAMSGVNAFLKGLPLSIVDSSYHFQKVHFIFSDQVDVVHYPVSCLKPGMMSNTFLSVYFSELSV